MTKKTKVLLVILIILMLMLIFSGIGIYRKKVFIKPGFDKHATLLKSKDKKKKFEDKYIEITKDYIFYINPTPKLKDKKLYINLYSKKTNKVYLKVRIYHDDEIIGESKLIKNDYYLDYIKVNKKLKSKQKIAMEIVAYEKDTYTSGGNVKLNSFVK